MAALNEGQQSLLYKYAGPKANLAVVQNRSLLNLYGLLRADQRQAATDGELKLDQLTRTQLSQLAAVMADLRPGATDLEHTPRGLKVEEPDDSDLATLTLLLRNGDGMPVRINRRASPEKDPWASFGPGK
jgi:hypothetical protein